MTMKLFQNHKVKIILLVCLAGLSVLVPGLPVDTIVELLTN